ncbi:hypothetical protein SPHINGO391_490194 [Sphingomonas aurantiaca]|uniref:Uncharacterized protein n=1 Tax=Sphingomonas aurantiaca TaxID=185949 RepID=A0A5E8A5I4_9SPHN|nr:hypothetical protein SPHINGO391_490194 [Sphingomonas aurantiaca]
MISGASAAHTSRLALARLPSKSKTRSRAARSTEAAIVPGTGRSVVVKMLGSGSGLPVQRYSLCLKGWLGIGGTRWRRRRIISGPAMRCHGLSDRPQWVASQHALANRSPDIYLPDQDRFWFVIFWFEDSALGIAQPGTPAFSPSAGL